MAETKIVPVILSGGAGTRLWPLSRKSMPKQMLRLFGDRTLIQRAIERASPAEGFSPPVIVAGAAHESLVRAQLAEIGVDAAAIILEPAGRNTAPAIGLAAHAVDEDALMLIMPSDHLIRDAAGFREAVRAAAPRAAEGWLVTFGIEPDRPETGYGYIEVGEPLSQGVDKVVRFVEKPDRDTAAAYLASGRFCWNAGIFLIRAGTYRTALASLQPAMAAAVGAAWTEADRDGNVVRPNRDRFLASPSDSIDYAVMEKAERIAVARVDIGWSDIGAFAALLEQLPADAAGNAIAGNVHAIDSRDCLIRSEGPFVAAIGVTGLSIIATADAVLVVANERAQEVKAIVDHLSKTGRDDMC